MQKWKFKANNDKLIELVLNHKKTATTSLYKEYIEKIPKIDEKSMLLFDNEKKACVVKNINVIITEFKNITKNLAYLEGEGDRSLNYYRNVHKEIFTKIDKDFNDDSLVAFEIFEVVEDLTKKRLKVAEKIVATNNDIFGKNKHKIYEINAGFNNDIFSVDEKYIIKVCTKKKLENKFKKEYLYYMNNKNLPYIPKLYKYDNSKKM